ncbi:MAG TPA: ABC transporter permease [Streptosporangiaceae bacterium]|nr:ABC transporter permease [Streptosporangiaceae bacterium]
MSDTAERSAKVIGPPPGSPGAGNGRGGMAARIGQLFLRQREASIVAIAVALFLYFWLSSTPDFVTHGSFVDIAQYMGPYVLIGIGLVLLMIMGEIDLSVGFVWTLAPFVVHFFVDSGLSTILAIIVTVLLLSLVGLVNGIVTTVFGVPSLIGTLAMGYIIFGFTLTWTAAQEVTMPTIEIGVGRWFGGEAWSEFLWATALVLVFHVFLTRTRWGLYTVSIGGNLLGARESGIKVNRIKVGNFMLCSSLGAVAGIEEAFRTSTIDPSAGQLSVVLIALAGVVIGGTAMTGGSGTMIGMWLGVLVLGVLGDGFNLRGISSNEDQIILGAAILLAMIANTYINRLRNAGRLQGKV